MPSILYRKSFEKGRLELKYSVSAFISAEYIPEDRVAAGGPTCHPASSTKQLIETRTSGRMSAAEAAVAAGDQHDLVLAGDVRRPDLRDARIAGPCVGFKAFEQLDLGRRVEQASGSCGT